MANILDFLRGLLTDGGAQQRFNGNPAGYIADHGFNDLSGEDVTEAIRVLARTLPDETSARLSSYTNGDGDLPPVRPQHGESELDAAIRQLRFAISLSPAAGPTDMEVTEPEPVVEEIPSPTEPASDPRWEGERQPVSVQTDIESTTETTETAPVPAAASAFDPYAAFGDEMAAIMRNASDQMQEVLARAEAIVREAEREAEGIRESAQVDAQTVRGMANQEAEGILQEARTQRDEAGVELTAARTARDDAEREANALMNEARSRRDEIKAAEEELRKRLEGVQSVFQSFQQGSVVPDEH